MVFISLASNNKNIAKIVKKAKELNLIVTDEISWDDGFKYSDKSNRNIKVIEFTQEIYNYIQELEPNVDMSKKRVLLPSHITIPTSEEVVKLGY